VFVSYRQEEPDRSWVRSVLVPGLAAQGLSVCVDYRTFRLGAPLVLEMGRAVESSRYTVAVVTPRFVRSTFTELETVLAEHLGLEVAQHRLLIILREPAQVRLGLRARLWLDLTDDADVRDGLTRLGGALRSDRVE
jgi:hypothetical protein